jgi:uncharacterized protein YjdB
LRTWLIVAGLLLTLAPALPAQVTEVQVTPRRFSLDVGKRRTLYAAGYDRQGNLVAGAQFTFTTSDPAVARVSSSGTVTAVGAGTATIEARSGERRATAAVTVRGEAGPARAADLASLAIEPASVALLPLEPVRLVPRALRSDGTALALPAITWKSLDPRIAAVDGEGLLVGVAPGHTMVQASASGITVAVPVAVDTAVFTTLARRILTPGATDTLFASVPAQGGRRLSAGLTWRSSDTSVVRVGGVGDLRAVGPGQADVIVSGYGMTGRVRIAVHRPVAAFTLMPRASGGPIQIPVGSTRRFEARPEAADSTPIPEVGVSWHVADTTIATFDEATGMLTAIRPGTTRLSARIEGFEPVYWTVEVIPAVTPSS